MRRISPEGLLCPRFQRSSIAISPSGPFRDAECVQPFQALFCSFSSVSKQIFTSRYSFCAIFLDLQDLRTLAPLWTQHFRKCWQSSRRNCGNFLSMFTNLCQMSVNSSSYVGRCSAKCRHFSSARGRKRVSFSRQNTHHLNEYSYSTRKRYENNEMYFLAAKQHSNRRRRHSEWESRKPYRHFFSCL